MNFLWIQDIECSEKIKNLYKTKNKLDIIDMVSNDLIKNYNTKYRNNGYTFFETRTKKIYKFKDNVLVNILNKRVVGNDEIINELKNEEIKIPQYIYDKFKNINKEKLLEIIDIFLNDAIVIKRNSEQAYIKNTFSEIIFVIDYHNYMLEDLITLKFKSIQNNSLEINNDKIKFTNTQFNLNKKEFIKQFDYLKSYNYQLDNFVEDIKNNYRRYTVNNILSNSFEIVTNNYSYAIINYNVVSIKDNKGLPIPTAISNKKIINTLNIENFNEDFEIVNEYMVSVFIKDLYKDYIKAKGYIEKLGLSIRVITKFILQNNLLELYKFLSDDIIYYGKILYDDYLKNEMIIQTQRFYYIIKNGVIINIKDLNQDTINECSIPFKPFKETTIIKNDILDLDIKDKIRTFIPYSKINKLKINNHAKERFNERISKNDNILDKEHLIKKDIYKYGEVVLGTYYLNTKLIKGLKNIYVVSNDEIISIWRINEFINELNNKYFLQVE